MKLGVLFSGGKDSTLALHRAMEKEDVLCLITMVSENKESYMFHTPNIDVTELQAKALGLPIIKRDTKGKPEKELEDLRLAIEQAISDFEIDGLVTGAVGSLYQSTRIERICDRLNIRCINPLWKKNPKLLLVELVSKGFKVIISGVFAYPLDKDWLGAELNEKMIRSLVLMGEEFGLNVSGEGGEIETTVLDAPLFKKRIEILESAIKWTGNSGVFIIKKARLINKYS